MTEYSPIESEFANSEEEAAYDAWFRAKVQRALESTRPTIPHDEAMARVRKAIDEERAAANLER